MATMAAQQQTANALMPMALAQLIPACHLDLGYLSLTHTTVGPLLSRLTTVVHMSTAEESTSAMVHFLRLQAQDKE